MIASIEIENLRGIRTGQLEGLLPLTILTGPNACGKSTVLDALLICANPSPGGAIGRAVARHPATLGGSRWLLGRPEESAFVRGGDGTNRWKIHLKCSHQQEGRVNCSEIFFGGERIPRRIQGTLVFQQDNTFRLTVQGEAISPIPFVRLVDPGLPVRLHETFSEVARTPRRQEVESLLQALIPDFRQLEILTEGSEPILHLTTTKTSVPVALAGDGIQALVQLALEIAAAPGGLVLVEEPEVYQHPRAIRQTARALLANVRRGVQVVLTTHSLELIDALLAEASGEDLEKMAVFNLKLDDGVLSYGRRAGKEISFARETLENDLR